MIIRVCLRFVVRRIAWQLGIWQPASAPPRGSAFWVGFVSGLQRGLALERNPFSRRCVDSQVEVNGERLVVSGRAPAIFSAPKATPHARRDTN